MGPLQKQTNPKCPVCGDKMVALFYSVFCDRCDNPAVGWFYHGYVNWALEESDLWSVQKHPVFQKADQADIWRIKQYSPSRFEIRHVLSYEPFTWETMPSVGDPPQIADIYYKVSKTHKFDKKDKTVILAASGAYLPDFEKIHLDKELSKKIGLST